jgi:hypothetical protein
MPVEHPSDLFGKTFSMDPGAARILVSAKLRRHPPLPIKSAALVARRRRKENTILM